MSRYAQVVFMQGDGASEALQLLEEHGTSRVIDYLAQWYGTSMEYRDTPSHGTRDTVVTRGPWLLSFNLGLGYIGLEYDDTYAPVPTRVDHVQSGGGES